MSRHGSRSFRTFQERRSYQPRQSLHPVTFQQKFAALLTATDTHLTQQKIINEILLQNGDSTGQALVKESNDSIQQLEQMISQLVPGRNNNAAQAQMPRIISATATSDFAQLSEVSDADTSESGELSSPTQVRHQRRRRSMSVGEYCPICLDVMNLNSHNRPSVVLQCNHTFHRDCIGSWLTRQQNCPNCRSNVNPI